MVRDFDRQRSELRAQIRKNNAILKEKNEIIEQLKGEKTRLEKRIAIVTVCSTTYSLFLFLDAFKNFTFPTELQILDWSRVKSISDRKILYIIRFGIQ